MSIEPHVLPASIGGLGGGVASELANTGNPVLVGLLVGLTLIVALGVITRATQRSRN